MLNALAKYYNRKPKETSKTQQEKKQQTQSEPLSCSVCGANWVTLYKVNGKRYCKLCRPTNGGETTV